jgi:hypothetical protein
MCAAVKRRGGQGVCPDRDRLAARLREAGALGDRCGDELGGARESKSPESETHAGVNLP